MRLDNPSISGSISYLGGGTNTISGIDAKITGSFTGSFTGEVLGTSSIATTASYIKLSNVDGSASLASRITINSASIASLETVSGSYANSASFASNISANSASIASLETVSGSYANSASFASNISTNSSSIGSLNAVSSSYLLNTTDTLTGDLTVTGNIIATTLNVQDVTASVVYSSGSNIFGSSSIDTQQFTGSILTSGSIEVNGDKFTVSGATGNTVVGGTLNSGAITSTGTITSTSTSTNTLAGKLRINGTTTTGLEIASSSGSSTGLKLYNDSSNDHAYILNHYNGNLALGTNNAAVITLNGTTATFAGELVSINAGRYFKIQNAAGNANFPTYSFQNDGNTGILSASSDSLGFITGGTTALTLDSAQDATFAGNLIIHNTSNAPFIDFVESGATSDSKARITMDQIDTNNGTLLFATENAGTLYNQFKITQTGNLLLSNDAASFNTSNAKLNVLPASNGVYQQWNYSPSNENFSLKLKETVTSGNVRYVFDQINNSTTYANALVFNQGNVGIGTDDPGQKLHVEGRGIFDSGGSSDILQIINDNGGGVFGMTSNLFALDLASTSNFRIRQGSSIPLYLKSDGNLGIGTATPTNGKVQIHTASAISFSPTVFTSGANLRLQTGGSAGTGVTTGVSMGVGGAAEAYIGAVQNASTYADIVFQTYNGAYDERMRIDSDGNVSIKQGKLSIGQSSENNIAYTTGETWIGSNGLRYNSGSDTFARSSATAQAAMMVLTTTADVEFYTQPSTSDTGTYALTPKMVIKGNGNIGIGTTNPDNILHIETSNAGGPQIQLESTSGTASAAFINFDSTSLQLSTQRDMVDGDWYDTSKSWGGISIQGPAGGSFITFNTAAASNTSPTERMRITSGGLLFVGDTSTNYGYSAHHIANSASQGYALIVRNSNTSTTNNSVIQLNQATTGTDGYFMICRQGDPNSGTNRLFIFSNGNVQNVNNSYAAISDERLKENIVDATPKLDDLMKVKIRNYNFIGQEDKQIGVIAQEIENVFPSLVEDTKEPESEKTTKSVKYSVFVPMLIKAIQELKAEIEILKNK